ncbi:hypothetical protein JOF53_007990 [Crossiella equi]|uniref:Uncharacterized protein n=1 Tax=Crossiella equi TaxID=130796 RepID=A0ABS5ARD3_9PSEU|nr:hypothetical protein [Crossiella equi]MBP2479118.1 hypothetical protein [Crossiella equi]
MNRKLTREITKQAKEAFRTTEPRKARRLIYRALLSVVDADLREDAWRVAKGQPVQPITTMEQELVYHEASGRGLHELVCMTAVSLGCRVAATGWDLTDRHLTIVGTELATDGLRIILPSLIGLSVGHAWNAAREHRETSLRGHDHKTALEVACSFSRGYLAGFGSLLADPANDYRERRGPWEPDREVGMPDESRALPDEVMAQQFERIQAEHTRLFPLLHKESEFNGHIEGLNTGREWTAVPMGSLLWNQDRNRIIPADQD